MSRSQVRSIALLSCLATTTACHTTVSAQGDALLVSPSREELSVIEDAIAQFYSGKRIPLSTSTFTNSSALVIDLNRLNDRGQPKNDMDATRPTTPQGQRFWLKKQGEQCLLVHEQTNKNVPLPGVNCQLSKN